MSRSAAIAVLGIALAMTQPLPAQLKSLLPAANDNQAAPATEKPEDTRKRLEQWHQQARDVLARLNADDADTLVPAGISPAEVEARRRDLEQMLMTTSGFIKTLEAAGEARAALEKALAEDAAWTGFKEQPPYSILRLDELQNERSSIEARLRSNKSSYDNLKGLLGSLMNETKVAEEAVSAALLAVQNAAPGQEELAKWRLEAARAKSRLLATRAAYLQASTNSFKERVKAAEAQLALTDRKIAIIKPDVVFSDEDFTRIEKIASDRKKSIDKEITAVASRLRTAVASRGRAQSAFDSQQGQSSAEGDSDELALARYRLEVAEERVESLQSIHEALEGLVHLENMVLKAYNDRRLLLTSNDQERRQQAIESLRSLSERLRTWISVIANERTACAADLSKIETSATVVSSDDPRFDLLNQQRAASTERLAMIERVHQALSVQRRLVNHWIDEHTVKEDDAGFLQRLGSFAGSAWQRIAQVWQWQIMSYEDKIEVDGQTITGKIPVTLGMLLRALLFFIIGYWVSSRIANHIQRRVVSRGHIAEAQAKTLRNWAMIVVGMCLVLGTLSFLKIPLTVFAFFGGALAIGLGFGTQTLIKNFISGIIVLAERKVRVGDILDVDGIVGTVVEVNARSSIIRSPDDVETMIPNSLFLENRVTNWTLSTSRMRRNVRLGVAYGTDPRTVIDILTECAGRHGVICKDPAPFAVFEDFGDSALIFSVYYWVEMGHGPSVLTIASDLRQMIEKRLTEAGISIPFPHRDIHLTQAGKPIEVKLSSGES